MNIQHVDPDHLNAQQAAAEVIEPHLPAMPDQLSAAISRDAAQALAAAGLLAAEERDAKVAARTLRGAADEAEVLAGEPGCGEWGDFADWLTARADRIERGGTWGCPGSGSVFLDFSPSAGGSSV